ncbi:MAG: alpha/beta hydrolase [Synechococcales cyanobacterium RM1_1_8]|nr:alpha/beta hydrolase [Synechococcales cyanobacterium RM1_1_8]
MTNASVSAWQHGFVETNDIRLHYVTQGEGELVILLHGFLEFWYSWRHQLPILSRHFKVVAPDLRGYNDSDKPAAGYDLETLGRDVKGLIQALGYEKARIVGHGWGGSIALSLAENFPQMVQSLALLSAPHPQRFLQEAASNLDQFGQSWYIWAAQVPNLPEWLVNANLPRLVSGLFQQQSVRKGAFSAEDKAMYEAALAKPGALRATLSYYRQLLSLRSLTQLLADKPQFIAHPTLILWGQDDTVFSHRLAKGLERLISAPCRMRLIDHCGHWINQEAPQTVNRELTQFLRKF